MNYRIIFSAVLVFSFLKSAFTQDQNQSNAYQFTPVIDIKHTPVKDQSRSGTCWSFATVSFIEAELIRSGKGDYDLSEMFFVNHAYRQKADRYIRYHGSSNFGPGGQAHDVLNIMKVHGIATQEEYPGMYEGENKHDHGELDAVLLGYIKAVSENKGGKLTPVWPVAFASIIDSYLGKLPDKSMVVASKDKKTSASKTLGLNPDDYVEVTSYMHHPFYSGFILEIPDNWSNSTYYNVPVDDLVEIMNFSLENGYTICWDGDVSDRGFSHSNNLAIIPDMLPVSNEGTEMEKWQSMTDKEKNELIYNFKEIRKEKNITQEMRQQAFENYQSTDDHLMHIVGKVKDQTGKEYFVVKNSWADKSNKIGGYLYMSEAYVRLNTLALLVHKNGIPTQIRKKME